MKSLIEEIEPFIRRKSGVQKTYSVPESIAKAVRERLISAPIADKALSLRRDEAVAGMMSSSTRRFLVHVPVAVGDALLDVMRSVDAAPALEVA